MIRKIKVWLKKIPILVRVKRQIWPFFDGTKGKTKHNLLLTFPAYRPYSAGRYHDRAKSTIRVINEVFPLLKLLSQTANEKNPVVTNIEQLSHDSKVRDSADKLKVLFDKFGSDKANNHNYHHLYGAILIKPQEISKIFEIGLGTNNSDVVSNMGVTGKPGASLRAFREYCVNATIYGADIDKRVLFQEPRIHTFYVNQLDLDSFSNLMATTPDDFDLIIDDGLHSPDANIASLEFGIRKIKKNGWIVIEDIRPEAINIWHIVASILPKDTFETHLFDADDFIVFAVKRLS